MRNNLSCELPNSIESTKLVEMPICKSGWKPRFKARYSQSNVTHVSKQAATSPVGNYERLKLGLKQLAVKQVPLLAMTLFISAVLPLNQSHAQNCYPNQLATSVMQQVRHNLEQQTYERTNAHWYTTRDQLQAAIAYEILTDGDEAPSDIQQIHFLNIKNETFMLLVSDNNQTCGFADLILVNDAKGRQAITQSESFSLGRGRIPDDTDVPSDNNKRSTQPGDPIVNMSEEEREAFRAIQGILNGQNPTQGLMDLLGSKK